MRTYSRMLSHKAQIGMYVLLIIAVTMMPLLPAQVHAKSELDSFVGFLKAGWGTYKVIAKGDLGGLEDVYNFAKGFFFEEPSLHEEIDRAIQRITAHVDMLRATELRGLANAYMYRIDQLSTFQGDRKALWDFLIVTRDKGIDLISELEEEIATGTSDLLITNLAVVYNAIVPMQAILYSMLGDFGPCAVPKLISKAISIDDLLLGYTAPIPTYHTLPMNVSFTAALDDNPPYMGRSPIFRALTQDNPLDAEYRTVRDPVYVKVKAAREELKRRQTGTCGQAQAALQTPSLSFEACLIDFDLSECARRYAERYREDSANALLDNNLPVLGLSAQNGELRRFRIFVPRDARLLEVSTFGGNGDADLYVRYDAVPTESIYDCASKSAGSGEICLIPIPKVGYYYVGVHAYSEIGGVNVIARYKGGWLRIGQPLVINYGSPQDGDLTYHLTIADYVQDAGHLIDYLEAGSYVLRIKTFRGRGDADLLVATDPESTNYLCRSESSTNNELCEINNDKFIKIYPIDFEVGGAITHIERDFYVKVRPYQQYWDLILSADLVRAEDLSSVIEPANIGTTVKGYTSQVTLETLKAFVTEDFFGDELRVEVFVDGTFQPVLRRDIDESESWDMSRSFTFLNSVEVRLWDEDDPDPDDFLGSVMIDNNPKNDASASFTGDGANYELWYSVVSAP
jgi:hypothetical protein